MMISFGSMNPRSDDGQLLLHAVRIGSDRLRQISRQFETLRVIMNARLAVSWH